MRHYTKIAYSALLYRTHPYFLSVSRFHAAAGSLRSCPHVPILPEIPRLRKPISRLCQRNIPTLSAQYPVLIRANPVPSRTISHPFQSNIPSLPGQIPSLPEQYPIPSRAISHPRQDISSPFQGDTPTAPSRVCSPDSTRSSRCAMGSQAFIASSSVLFCAPSSINSVRGRRCIL